MEICANYQPALRARVRERLGRHERGGGHVVAQDVDLDKVLAFFGGDVDRTLEFLRKTNRWTSDETG